MLIDYCILQYCIHFCVKGIFFCVFFVFSTDNSSSWDSYQSGEFPYLSPDYGNLENC